MENSEQMVGRWVDDRLAALRHGPEWRPDAGAAFARFERRKTVRTRRIGFMAAATVAAGLLIAAFPASRAAAQRACDTCIGMLRNSAKPAPLIAQSKRVQAPDFLFEDMNKEMGTLGAFRNKVVVVNFWATWCPPCKAEIPWFRSFQRDYRDRGFMVIGLSVDEGGWGAILPTAQSAGYPMALAGAETLVQYGVKELPATFLIDREGRIAASHTGLVAREVYKAQIEALLTEY